MGLHMHDSVFQFWNLWSLIFPGLRCRDWQEAPQQNLLAGSRALGGSCDFSPCSTMPISRQPPRASQAHLPIRWPLACCSWGGLAWLCRERCVIYTVHSVPGLPEMGPLQRGIGKDLTQLLLNPQSLRWKHPLEESPCLHYSWQNFKGGAFLRGEVCILSYFLFQTR